MNRMNQLFNVLSEFEFGDMTGIFFNNDSKVSFALIPSHMRNNIAPHRKYLNDTKGCKGVCDELKFNVDAYTCESMAQWKLAGDAYGGAFSAGSSLRNSESVDRMKFLRQERNQNTLKTVFFDSERHLELSVDISYLQGQKYILMKTSVTNYGASGVTLDMLSSFSLGFLSPFQMNDGTNQYKVHRWLSNWSAEGRLESRSVEELNMEMSWSGGGVRSLRFGQSGSMVTKGFFPQIAFEDCENQVIWGVALETFGSWQLELSRSSDFFNLNGGMVDREFGAWQKELRPNESFATTNAIVSCVNGSLDELCSRLVSYQNIPYQKTPESEKELPVIFNEWCTSWGRPVAAKLSPILERLAHSGVKYFVLDCGWFNSAGDGLSKIGDWNIPQDNYPDGLRNFSDKIREAGLLPGIWFEFEVVTTDSILYREHPNWLLKLDGKILHSETRCFLDFQNPEVIGYLDGKLINMLKENNFAYLKVDYNAPTGGLCDGDENKAEALRKHIVAVERYFHHLRHELPELVLEICSSGGHRLSPAWMKMGAMGSFSDAHEGYEIPLIAANTAQLIPMTHNQIWAVLRQNDDENRLFYSLSTGFMGRLCISGDIARLNDNQTGTMFDAINFYNRISNIFQIDGINHIERKTSTNSYMKPEGYQVFTRTATKRKLLIFHTFQNTPASLSCCIGQRWKIIDVFCPKKFDVKICDDNLLISGVVDFCGFSILFEKDPKGLLI